MRLIGAGLIALAATAPQAQEDSAAAAVRALYARFEAAVQTGAGTLPQRVEAIGPAVERAFDIPGMLRRAVGPEWERFAPEQQAALTEAFRHDLVVTYARRLRQAAGGRFAVTGSQPRAAQHLVQTRVVGADGVESLVDFLMGADNRVADVLLNGNVSELATRRASFAAPLKSGGAEGLLKFLRERTDGMLSAQPSP